MKVQDRQGNVQFDTGDLSAYNSTVVGVISAILEDLLKNTTLRMESVASDESLTNVYTKEASDSRFVSYDALRPTMEDVVNTLVMASLDKQGFLTDADIQKLKTFVDSLGYLCEGIDSDGNSTDAYVNYNFASRLNALDDAVKGLVYVNQSRIQAIEDSVFTKLGSTQKAYNFATLNQMGDVSGFDATKNKTIVGVITQNQSDISGIDKRVKTLETASTNTGSKVGTLETDVSNIKKSVSESDTRVSDLETGVSEISDDLGTLETDLGDLNTKVGSDTIDTKIGATTLVGAVNQLFTSCSDFKKSVSAAITANGVETAADATTQTIVNNISKIRATATTRDGVYNATGSDDTENKYIQLKIPYKATYTSNAKLQISYADLVELLGITPDMVVTGNTILGVVGEG